MRAGRYVKDVEEVVNYVRAMNHGLARLPELPLSLRLIREIHGVLMEGVRGQEREPGEFRRSQNWIGAQGPDHASALRTEGSVLPITVEYADVQASLPRHHGDPFDRLLIAQSQVENVHLVSSDSQFDQYGVNRIWYRACSSSATSVFRETSSRCVRSPSRSRSAWKTALARH
jgi:hypothetical protein